jgi:GTP-binding protein EngB required for normal cell division
MVPRLSLSLLALPSSLRPLLFKPPLQCSTWAQTRRFHESFGLYIATKPSRAQSIGAFTTPHSPTLPLIEVSLDQLLESPDPKKSLADELETFYTRKPATFYDGTLDFYHLKKNTRIPEICVLGRSNVGKSTFVNGLAGRSGSKLAHTSSKAGRTRTINTYGFGPEPALKDIHAEDKSVRKTEDLPKHSLYIVDTPGYGHRSLENWGRSITLYLSKRTMVKGAVLLIDGEVGPKDKDVEAMQLLCDAGLKTVIVLTKADKAKGAEMLQKTCRAVWEHLRDTGSRDLNKKWEWDRDFFVTAVGSTKKGSTAQTLAVARLAVSRLAGILEEKRRPELESSQGWSGKVVSFDDIQYAPSQATRTSATTRKVTDRVVVSPREMPPQPRRGSDFSTTELFAKEGYTPRTPLSRMPMRRENVKAWPKSVTPNPKVSTQPPRRQSGRASGFAELFANEAKTGKIETRQRTAPSRPEHGRQSPTRQGGSAFDALERAAAEASRPKSTIRTNPNASKSKAGEQSPRRQGNSPFDALERAASGQQKARAKTSGHLSKTSSWGSPNPTRTRARFFHTYFQHMTEQDSPSAALNASSSPDAHKNSSASTPEPPTPMNPEAAWEDKSIPEDGALRARRQRALEEFITTLQRDRPIPTNQMFPEWDKETTISPAQWKYNQSWGIHRVRGEERRSIERRRKVVANKAQAIAGRRVQMEEMRAALAAERERRISLMGARSDEMTKRRSGGGGGGQPALMSADSFKAAIEESKKDDEDEDGDEEEEEKEEEEADGTSDDFLAGGVNSKGKKTKQQRKWEKKMAKKEIQVKAKAERQRLKEEKV